MKRVLLVLALCAVAGGSAMFGREYNVALFTRGSVLSAFEDLATGAGPAAPPLSSRSMRELFETCGAVQQGAVYRFQPADIRQAVDTSCTRLARMALERNPTLGGAHTILMLGAETTPQRVEALVRSQLTAPRESWHAKLRLVTGLGLYGAGHPRLDGAVDRDIGFMIQSTGGRVWLARLYRSEPALRATLVSLIDRSPNVLRIAFLDEVRRLDRT